MTGAPRLAALLACALAATWAAAEPSPAARPAGRELSTAASRPAVRVHYAEAEDAERAAAALRAATKVLDAAKALGFAPLDDGDGEIDLFLAPTADGDGAVALETRAVAGRGASGYVVVDPRADDDALADQAARGVAALVFAALDADAPAAWREASSAWLAEKASGSAPGAARAAAARWNHAERGLGADDRLLARGAASLFAAAGAERAERLLVLSWRLLAARGDNETAFAAIDAACRQAAGVSLVELQLRAGARLIAGGAPPARVAARIDRVAAADLFPAIPVEPLGAAVVQLLPDPRHPSGAVVAAAPAAPGWSALLLAHRRDGAFDAAPLPPDADGAFRAHVPWSDYDEATLLLGRPEADGGDGALRLSAEPAASEGLFGLAAFAARPTAAGEVEIAWSTAWEGPLFGWTVERASSADGPWRPLRAAPVPALDRDGAEYVVVDPAPAARRRAFYRVVAVTAAGLRVAGPAVALRPVP